MTVGSQLRAGFAKQTAANTAATSLVKTVDLSSRSVSLQPEFQEFNLAYGDVRSMKGRKMAKMPAGGSIEAPLDLNTIGDFLYFLFRGGVKTVGTAPNFTHTFIVANKGQDTDIPTFTWFQQENEAQNVAFKGGVIDKLTIEVDGQMVKWSADLVFRGKDTNVAAQTYQTVSGDYVMARQVSAKFASTVAGLASGTSPSCLRKLKIEFSNDAKQDLECLNGSADAGRTLLGGFKTSISFTMDYNTAEIYNWHADGENNQKAWLFEFVNNAGNKLSFTVQPSIPKISPQTPLNDTVVADITLDAIPVQVDGSDLYDVKATLTNSTASYTA